MHKLATLLFAIVITSNPLAAQQQSPQSASMQCKGSPVQVYACFEREYARALGDLVQKTRAFISVAVVSCPFNRYEEWQASIKEMTGLYLIFSIASIGSGVPAGPLIAQAQNEILDSRFAIADAALRNGGRYCRKYADAEYRQILTDYRDPTYAFARDRAKVGIDDVRALPPSD